MLTVFSVGIFFINSWLGIFVYSVILLFSIVYLYFCGLSVKQLLIVSGPIYLICAITLICNLFSPTYTGQFNFISGLLTGIFYCCRILLLMWASLAVVLTIDITRIEHAFASILTPLRDFRIPVDDIAMILSIALRFIPNIFSHYKEIVGAQWSRGAHFSSGPISERVKTHALTFVPLLISLFRSADSLSVALVARSYGLPGVNRSNLYEMTITRGEIYISVVFSLLCILTAVVL